MSSAPSDEGAFPLTNCEFVLESIVTSEVSLFLSYFLATSNLHHAYSASYTSNWRARFSASSGKRRL